MNIKESMNNMPDTLNTKAEVEAYYKAAMKKALELNKKNNDAKPKKELNEYQRFMKDNISIVKEKNSHLTGPQVFSLIATMWKEHKASGKPSDTKAVDAPEVPSVPSVPSVPVVPDVPEESNDTEDKAAVAAVAPVAVVAPVADAKKKEKKAK